MSDDALDYLNDRLHDADEQAAWLADANMILRSENARLQAELIGETALLEQNKKALELAEYYKADNARLRAALEVYADKSHWFPVPNGWLFTVWGSPWKTAEEALSKENEK